MDEVWMLDYMNAILPRLGVFESESAAWAWVQEHDSDRKHRYVAFKLTMNHSTDYRVPHTAPNERYISQR